LWDRDQGLSNRTAEGGTFYSTGGGFIGREMGHILPAGTPGGGTYTPRPFEVPGVPAYVREGVAVGDSWFLVPNPPSQESQTYVGKGGSFTVGGTSPPLLDPDYTPTPPSIGWDGWTVAGDPTGDWWIDICSLESGYLGLPEGPFGEPPDTEGLPWRSSCLFKLTWSPKTQVRKYY